MVAILTKSREDPLDGIDERYLNSRPHNMVTCDSESVHSGFRLGERAAPPPPKPCGSVSSASLYKQKIDALFDDTRSVASLGPYGGNLTANLTRQNSKVSSMRGSRPTIFEHEENLYSRSKINNSVQDRIERMFAEMASESRGPLADPIGVHGFSVDYLGSTPLHQKVTSLSGLQLPLKNLYFAYRKNLRNKNAFSGQLEISKSGLKVRYQGEKGDLEQLNPFPTIAVWSAVKFVVQASEKENNILSYAFLPLITDPDNIDRHLLFQTLESADKKYILSHNENAHSPLFAVVMRKIGVAKQLECHGFVCQTSEDAIVVAATLYKSLMSHMSRQSHDPSRAKKKLKNRNGVSCMSIASSATHNDVPIRPPRKKRSTSSLSGDSDRGESQALSQSESFRGKPKPLKSKKRLSESLPPPPPPPTMPPNNIKMTVEQVKAKLDSIKNVNESSGNETNEPHKVHNNSSNIQSQSKISNNNSNSSNESSVRSKVSEKIELFTELEKRRNIQRPPTMPPPIPVKPADSKLEDVEKEPLRRNHSGRKSINDSGDILTKVAIPRSGSFLNAGGLTRYKSIGQRNNGKKGGGSPLGFNELFNEFRVQENLHSMDEILNAIIDAEGMSFNDLKPIYKEFLLKLAVTLTKDELFQHSKAIMKKQKKKILRRNSTVQNKRKKMFKGANGLRMVFRMPFGKEVKKKDDHSSKLDPKTFEFHSLTTNMKNLLTSESSVSTSSYDLRQFHPKEPALPPPKRHIVKKRTTKRSDKVVQVSKRNGKVSRPGERTSASEDSDFHTMSGRLGCQNRNSSSGYVSCSECESESCIDRCYCSLKDDCKSKCYCSAVEMKGAACRKSKINATAATRPCKECVSRERCYDPNCDYSYCGCDSESCADSNKCYCRGDFPPPPQRNPPPMKQSKGSVKSSVKSSKSLEYLKNPSQKLYSERLRQAFDDCYYEPLKPRQDFRPRSNSMMGSKGYCERPRYEERSKRCHSTDNLGLDYELFLQNKGKESSYRRNMQRLTVRSTGGQDALSVKKSAEMAALFADVRLSQRTDVRNLLAPSKASNKNLFSSRNGLYTSSFNHISLSRKTSLEDTLGYLP